MDFVRMVRDALAHLYDPVHLLRHPLAERLAPLLPGTGNTAQSLRSYLLDAIECLAPPGRSGNGPSEKDQRPYTVLVQRYVGGLSMEDCAAALHVGSRQVRREHEEGVAALATHLWRLCREAQPAGEPGGSMPRQDGSTADAADGGGLAAELAALGVELASQSLEELVTSLRSAARALAAEYGAVLNLVTTASASAREDGGRCLCDRTLARQAILATIGALACGRPGYITLATAPAQGEARPRPGLHIEAMPPVRVQADERGRLELERARSFMAAQGGSLQLSEAEEGVCRGVSLLFRSEGRGRVLLVDDNEKLLQLYARYLSLGPYEAATATSAAEAEAWLEREHADAVVLDVMMRGEDGWELLERLRARPETARLPVIVCSVLDEPRLALLLGAQASLKKPIVADDLLEVVRRVTSKG
ncbi:MAG: response regulator [Anaerolineae bacterium]